MILFLKNSVILNFTKGTNKHHQSIKLAIFLSFLNFHLCMNYSLKYFLCVWKELNLNALIQYVSSKFNHFMSILQEWYNVKNVSSISENKNISVIWWCGPCFSASPVTGWPSLSSLCLNKLCSTSSCCSPATSMASMLKSKKPKSQVSTTHDQRNMSQYSPFFNFTTP